MIFYYTATGNCLYAAKQLGGQKLVSIPQALKNGELSFEDDVIGIVSPDYAAELPLTVRTFLEKAELKAIAIFKKTNNNQKQQTNVGNPAAKQNRVRYEPRQGAGPDFGPSIHEGGPSS